MFRQLDAHLSALQELLGGGDLCLQRSLWLNNASRGFLLVLSGSSVPAPGDFGAVPCLSGAMAQKKQGFIFCRSQTQKDATSRLGCTCRVGVRGDL